MALSEDRIRLDKILDQLVCENVLKPGNWVLAGSGVMVLEGLERERPMGDVDIFMATRDWFDIYYKFAMQIEGYEDWSVFTTDPNDPKRRCDPPYLYKIYLSDEEPGLEVNIFAQWRVRGIGDIDVNQWVHSSQDIKGWPCVPLRLLFDWKRSVGRAKDMDDIRIMSNHFEEA
jgi:hypothetical protein